MPTNRIAMPGARRDFAYYAAKDQQMARDAKCGVMLWDGKSKGTLNNIQELLDAGKKTLVYLASETAFYKLSTQEDLDALLQRCDPTLINEAQRPNREKLRATRQQRTFHTDLEPASPGRSR